MNTRIQISKSPIINEEQYAKLPLDIRTTYIEVEKNVYKPIKLLTADELQDYKIKMQKRELYFFNRASLFGALVDNLEEEADQRGIELEDLSTQFHANRRKVKSTPDPRLSDK